MTIELKSLHALIWEHVRTMRDVQTADTIFSEISDRDVSKLHYETLCWNADFLVKQAVHFQLQLLGQLEALRSELRDLVEMMHQVQSDVSDSGFARGSSIEVETHAEPLIFAFNAVLASIVSETDAASQLVAKYLEPDIASGADSIPRVVSCLEKRHPDHAITRVLVEAYARWMRNARRYRNTVIHRYQLVGVGKIQAEVADTDVGRVTRVSDTIMVPRSPVQQYHVWREGGGTPPRWHTMNQLKIEIPDPFDETVLARLIDEVRGDRNDTDQPEMVPIEDLAGQFVDAMISTTADIIGAIAALEFRPL